MIVRMSTRIPWDKYETALLIDMYIQVRDNKIKRNDAVKELSNILRSYAYNKGQDIDAVYRNENGISMRMYEMKSLFGDGNGLKKTSRLFSDMVDLYRNNRKEYDNILHIAKTEYCKDI